MTPNWGPAGPGEHVNWSEPPESPGSSYLASMRAHKLVVVGVTLATLIAAIAWLQLRSPTYEATARMLIAPLPQDDTTFLGLQLLRDSGDPTRTAQTAATLAETPASATLAAKAMGGDWTADKVRESISLQPEGQSNILDVTASTSDAAEAAELATTYVKAVTQARDEALHQEVEEELDSAQARLATANPSSPTATALSGRINRLSGLLESGDPTLTPSSPALVPTSSSGAGAIVVLPLALIVGLVLGGAAALLLDSVNRRIRDERELLRVYPLPVLARVPRLKRSTQKIANPPAMLMPQTREAFRTMITQLETVYEADKCVMVTSASTGDGKTTSSVNLAVALAGAGHSVTLLDLDLRKPSLASSLNIDHSASIQEIVSRLENKSGFADLLVEVPSIPSLKVLSVSAGPEDAAFVDALNHRLPGLMETLRQQTTYIVVDTAPLGEVSDALRVAQIIDVVVLIARVGNTQRRNLQITRDLLERTDCRPAGYLLIGGHEGATSSYY